MYIYNILIYLNNIKIFQNINNKLISYCQRKAYYFSTDLYAFH